MKEWIDGQTMNDLKNCFGHFDQKDSWSALFSTMSTFRRLAKKTAKSFGYQYPDRVDTSISKWVDQRYKEK